MGYFSNGTEGAEYEDEHCEKCAHNIEDGCPILLLHLLYNYDECNKKDSFLHVLIPRDDKGQNMQCSMFIESAVPI